jgi:hypothetical protein
MIEMKYKCRTYESSDECNNIPTHFYTWKYKEEPMEIICRCEKHKSVILKEVSYEEVLVLEIMQS